VSVHAFLHANIALGKSRTICTNGNIGWISADD
jgi:hypothetical protein